MNITNDDFMKAILKLEAVEVLGVAKLMGIKIINEETKEPIAAEEILSNMIIKYNGFNRAKRKNLMKIIKGQIKR